MRELALKNKIPAVRLRFNWGGLTLQRRIYSTIVNSGLARAGLAKTSKFCEIRLVDRKLLALKEAIEVMVHPVLGENNKILNYVNGKDLDALVNKYLPKRDFVTYDYLNRGI